MAKITPGAIISEIRGTVAASTYSRNKGKAVMRNRVTPINRRSTGQTQKRQQLSSFASAWRGLTEAQRAGWNSAAQNFPQSDNLGQTIFLSGEQLYVRFNLNLTLIGEATIDDAPAPVSFAVLALGVITATAAGVFTIAYTPTPVPADFSLVIRATRPVSQGKSFVSESEFRFIQDEAAAAISPANIAAAYTAIFGALTGTAGQKIFVEVFLVSDLTGQAGQKVRASVIVA